MLSVQHFTKKYGSKVAVSDLSLDVMPGDIYGFIGHNGAGKTTLIKSIVGAQPFEGGAIFVDSKNVLVDPVGTKQVIAYVPDNPDIYEFMSGIKYLNYVCDIFGVPAENRVERITTLANRLGITDSLANAIGSYSHGMKQKLVLISALLHEPKLIILDEPFVGLDPAASFELKKMLHELADRGSAVFFSLSRNSAIKLQLFVRVSFLPQVKRTRFVVTLRLRKSSLVLRRAPLAFLPRLLRIWPPQRTAPLFSQSFLVHL